MVSCHRGKVDKRGACLKKGMMLRSKTLFIVAALVLALLPISNAFAQESTVAVLTFKVEEISESAAEALANVARREVITNGKLTLIDRDRTDAIFAEQGMMMAGGCYDVGCLVELGKVLGAERVITGSINLIGRKYMIEIRSAHVATGRIEALETREYSGSIEGLIEPVKILTRQLLARLTNDNGVINITTFPAASAISIDNQPEGFAPLTIERPGGMRYHIKAVRNGYLDQSEYVNLVENDTTNVVINLAKKKKEKRYREPFLRAFFGGGFPLNQASSSLDTRLSWGDGETIGGKIQVGSYWRFGIGSYKYSGEIDYAELETDLYKNPEVEGEVFYASLMLMMGDEDFAPFFSGGLCTMTRTVSLTPYDEHYAVAQSYTTDSEMGWMASAGVEISVAKFMVAQIEIIHARSRVDSEAEDNDEDRELYMTLDSFVSHTSVNFNIGFKF
jgi:PEGA domain